MTQPFSGFSQQGLNFLQQVRIENDKAWFDGNRDIYDRELLAPFRALVEQLAPGMLATPGDRQNAVAHSSRYAVFSR